MLYPMSKFLYVSRSAVRPPAIDAVIADIVATSITWNEAHGLTGALMYADGAVSLMATCLRTARLWLCGMDLRP